MPTLGTLSSCWVAMFKVVILVLVYLIIFYFILPGCYLLETCSFLMREREGVDPEGRESVEELREEEGGATVLRVYCIKKESTFNKRKKLQNKNNDHISLASFFGFPL